MGITYFNLIKSTNIFIQREKKKKKCTNIFTGRPLQSTTYYINIQIAAYSKKLYIANKWDETRPILWMSLIPQQPYYYSYHVSNFAHKTMLCE